ncbi:MAG TPA: cytochrome bc complex cytochrome b subunit [Actinomycetes bacterium]|jgi:ubiquinol-cytochrome c reductase cytochrome b subunit|nr:cytochrome bc complex cytochrome b subunit [Actinomycetes bacterium]
MSVLETTVKYLDERLGAASAARKLLRKVFPDHWSFLLGEIALFCLVVLIFTGVFLTFFYTPDARTLTYAGAYAPLRGERVSAAYESVLRLSFEVRAGLIMRQTHHWAALVFVAAIVVHLCRVFFTGAFRRPRELNWVIGVVLLLLAMAMGFTGYSLPDDLLSGIGLRIANAVVLAIPVVGTWVSSLLFGGEFPAPEILSRLFVFHVMLLPALLLALVGLHLAILVLQKHTQFPGPGRTERNVVGKRFWPEQTFKSVALLLFVTAVTAGLGGLAQINPVWQYGPYEPFNVTSPAQPDWYIGFLDGALRLAGPWRIKLFGYEISEVFWPAILVPGIAFGVLTLWPWVERRFTRDRAEHHLLDRPRDAPLRTAIGAAGLWMFFVMFLEGGNDIFGVLLDVSVESITRILQVAFVVGPVVVGAATYFTCRSLKTSQLHPARPNAGLALRRTATGGYETVPLDPTPAGAGHGDGDSARPAATVPASGGRPPAP